MTIYEKAKSLVTAREAAEHYGLMVNRYGMAWADGKPLWDGIVSFPRRPQSQHEARQALSGFVERCMQLERWRQCRLMTHLRARVRLSSPA